MNLGERSRAGEAVGKDIHFLAIISICIGKGRSTHHVTDNESRRLQGPAQSPDRRPSGPDHPRSPGHGAQGRVLGALRKVVSILHRTHSWLTRALSELHVFRGHQPSPTGFVMGHEFTGYVHEVGSDVKTLKVGDRVVCPFTISWCVAPRGTPVRQG
jgi:hypothetical protein